MIDNIELEMVRLNLDTALNHLDGALHTMAKGLQPTLSLPLARQEVFKARVALDFVLRAIAAQEDDGTARR